MINSARDKTPSLFASLNRIISPTSEDVIGCDRVSSESSRVALFKINNSAIVDIAIPLIGIPIAVNRATINKNDHTENSNSIIVRVSRV